MNHEKKQQHDSQEKNMGDMNPQKQNFSDIVMIFRKEKNDNKETKNKNYNSSA